MPVIVGGTGLYIKNLFEGMFVCPENDEKLRNDLYLKDNTDLKEYLNKKLIKKIKLKLLKNG